MTAKAEPSVTVLKPARGWVALNLRDLWLYRELLYFLAWRDVKVRYKQAALGILWAVIQPALTVVVFTLVFGQGLKVSTDNNIPYPLFSLAAVLPWNLFQGALQRSSVSLVSNTNLLTKVYFPRLVIPLAAIGAALLDFAITFALLVGLMIYYHTPFTWNMFLLVPLTLLVMITALAVGLWLSALNVQYRDVQQMIPFLLSVWMYASPVVYSTTLITSAKWKLVYALNPMVGVIQGFRWALLGGSPPGPMMAVSAAMMVVLLVSGLFYFRRMERIFADVI
jgi:lipopolysaccharide transport system permease protein